MSLRHSLVCMCLAFAIVSFAQATRGEEPAAQTSAPVPLESGDRVVFLGDSITQAGAGEGGYVTRVREAIARRLPDAKVEIIGAGISGNRVPDLQKRLDRDVLAKKPTVCVIYIGINDVWHLQRSRGTSKEDFEAGLNDILARLMAAKVRPILCTPSVIGEKNGGANELDPLLEEYSAISRAVAAKHGVQLIDLRKQFVEHLKEANKDDAGRDILTTDGVHLNAAGNAFLAERMLEGLGVRQE